MGDCKKGKKVIPMKYKRNGFSSSGGVRPIRGDEGSECA